SDWRAAFGAMRCGPDGMCGRLGSTMCRPLELVLRRQETTYLRSKRPIDTRENCTKPCAGRTAVIFDVRSRQTADKAKDRFFGPRGRPCSFHFMLDVWQQQVGCLNRLQRCGLICWRFGDSYFIIGSM